MGVFFNTHFTFTFKHHLDNVDRPRMFLDRLLVSSWLNLLTTKRLDLSGISRCDRCVWKY